MMPLELQGSRCSRPLNQHCANDLWLNLCSEIQNAANTENTNKMYHDIKKAMDTSAINTALLKTKAREVSMDQSRQQECCVEHYLELYATQNVDSDAAPEALPHLSVMES